MQDMITIDPHPHCLDEFLIKIDYDLVETPPPMPWPSEYDAQSPHPPNQGPLQACAKLSLTPR